MIELFDCFPKCISNAEVVDVLVVNTESNIKKLLKKNVYEADI